MAALGCDRPPCGSPREWKECSTDTPRPLGSNSGDMVCVSTGELRPSHDGVGTQSVYTLQLPRDVAGENRHAWPPTWQHWHMVGVQMLVSKPLHDSAGTQQMCPGCWLAMLRHSRYASRYALASSLRLWDTIYVQTGEHRLLCVGSGM